jgi:vitamin B12 transporter
VRVAPFDVVSFDLALSVASARTAGPGPTPNFVSPEVRGGIRVRPIPELDLYASGARYVRVPTLGETYGASDSVLGNPKLVPERGPTVEAGARFSRAFGKNVDLALEGVFFTRWASDLIVYERSSFGILRPFNVASARVIGGEATAAAAFARLVTIEGSFTVTDGRDITGGGTIVDTRLPFLAPLAGSIGARVDFREPLGGRELEDLELASTLVGRGPRKADAAGLVELPAQLTWDAEAVVALAGGTFTIRARVSNLTDDHSTDAVGYPLPGRAGHVALETVLR